MAKVIKEFFGVPDGEHQARTFNVGDVVAAGSDLERVAIEQGWCKKKVAHRNKSLGSAPVNKSGSSRPARPARKRTVKSSKKSATK